MFVFSQDNSFKFNSFSLFILLFVEFTIISHISFEKYNEKKSIGFGFLGKSFGKFLTLYYIIIF